MPFFDKYPYTNFHNINLDWVLQRVKEWGELVEQNNTAFHDLEEANEDFKNYVTSYLENLDVQAQIDDKLDRMFESGELTEYLQPYVSSTVTTWLDENITEPTGVIIDSSLTVAGACADAKATGDALETLKNDVIAGSISKLARNLLIKCLESVVFYNQVGAEYLNSLKYELNNENLIIEFNQPYIFDYGTSLDTIKQYLRVSTINSQGFVEEVTNYTLSGSLNSPISTVTVTYNAIDSYFNVCCAPANRWVNDVLTIPASLIVNGFMLSTFPYHDNAPTRLLYQGLLFDFDNRYKYTIRVTSSISNINVACRAMLRSRISYYANNDNIGTLTDTGWQSNNFTYNANGEIGDNYGVVFIPLRKSNNSNISQSELTNVVITRTLRG